MRRIIKYSSIIIILAGIYLLLPFLFGIATQRYTTQFLQNENKTLGNVLGIQLDFADYNRGWFHSTAVLEIEKKTDNGDLEIIKKIPIDIEHGPSYRFKNRFWIGYGMISSNDVPLGKDSPYDISFQENVRFSGERAAVILFNNKKNASPGNFQIGSLILHIRSNLKANQFLFSLLGSGLHFQDPQNSISTTVQNLNAQLQANYIGDRNWELTLGLGLHQNQLTATLPDMKSAALTANVDSIDVNGVHFDSQKMAKLLEEVIELKQATDSQQSVRPTAWMALLQQFLTEMIHNDTSVNIAGLSITTPMGQLLGHYAVSFPTLSATHDYFDVATRNVGTLQISVPHWTYTDAQTNKTFELNALQYNENNNTVFSRQSKMTLGELAVKNTQPTPETVFSASGFSYQGALFGDVSNLSQTMEWQLGKLCFENNCFDQIQGEIEFLGMNYDAFRGIAAATQQVVQYNPNQTTSIAVRWMDLANAYAKLISPQTKVVLTHDMNTPEGKMKLHGELSWPDLVVNTAATSTLTDDMSQASYELHLLFPAAYVDMFLNQQKTMTETNAKTKTKTTEKTEPSFEMQTAQFLQYALSQGYLKKVGAAYVMDLTGKGKVVTINGVAWKMPG